MKLSKDYIIKMATIWAADADVRLEEWEEHKTLNPKYENYDQSVVKEFFPNGEHFDIENMEGWLGILEGKLFITFRGVDSLYDWIRAIILSKKVVPYVNEGTRKEIKVHKGFLRNYLCIREFIKKKVEEYNVGEIAIYGHSMGAAVAALCGLDIKYNNPEKTVEVFASGMPRLGNKEFVRSFEKHVSEFAQVEYGSDLIPQIIMEIMGYKHLKNMVHIGPKRRFGIGTKKHHHWDLYIDAMTKEFTDDFLKSL